MPVSAGVTSSLDTFAGLGRREPLLGILDVYIGDKKLIRDWLQEYP